MDEKETGRLEAFSDGVFAIAITLLVLELKLPSTDQVSAGLVAYLLNQWPMFLAYVTSFATIGIMWVNHHRLFTHIKRADHNLLLLNLLLLLIVTFIPFPTELLATFAQKPQWLEAALIYSATNIVLAICFNFLWRYAAHENRLLGAQIDEQAVRRISRQYLFGPALYAIAFVLAYLYVPLSLAMNALLATFFALPGQELRQRPAQDSDREATKTGTGNF